VESHFVETGGARVHYLRAGSGPPLLLIHGIIGGSGIFRRNIPALAAHATVYALDLLGMGRSDRVPGLAAGLEPAARRVLATMDALGLPETDIAAASHGGAVAMMLAAIAPERVRSLILFAPANPYSTKADWMLKLYNTVPGSAAARLAPLLPRWFQQLALRRMFGNPRRMPKGSVDTYREALRVPGTMPHVLAMVRCWFADMEKLRQMLPRIATAPTLLVWGDRDRVVSLESGRRLEQELAAKLIVFPGGGHLVFDEFADEANRLMSDWLTRNP
jgi:pimeloyl-ACP methyl ester carboxylesterase